MPRARKKRDSILEPNLESSDVAAGRQFRCAHYTTAEAALKIINSKRMWMRNTTCMSDYREVQHGFEDLRAFFSDAGRRNSFIAALDVCVPGAAQEAINLFDQHWNNILRGTFIVSLSEHVNAEDLHGRLSMWRAFGGTARVAIVFNVPWISPGTQALNVTFSPVSYFSQDESHSVMQEVIDNVKTNGAFLSSVERNRVIASVFNMFLDAVTCRKHEGFREEREWRAIYSPTMRASKLMEFSTEIIEGIPQPIFKVPMDAAASPELADIDIARIFDRLIIGPSQFPEE